jgi:metallophosphoesterase (TIGR00282 family)
MNILIIGDVYGDSGLRTLKRKLPQIKKDERIHMVIANGENVDKGLGIKEAQYKELMSLGIQAITMGNHTYHKREIYDFIEDSNIIRPANYPSAAPGKGVLTIKYNDKRVTVINMMGRIFMGDSLNNPFAEIDRILETVNSDYILVDFHAEATSEKLAFAHYVDGRVTCVYGTHTHVPTADNLVLPNGTLYITDVGMTGPLFGILGANKETVIHKFTTGLPARLTESTDPHTQFNAIVINTDKNSIKRINIFE